jgi:uncharacterized protein YyaL (SSP411 family)
VAAARYAGHPRALAHAQRALDRIWTEGFDEQLGVAHRLSDRESGEYAEDHAFVAQALLDIHEVTQDPAALERAQQVVDVALRRFRDSSGALRDRPHDALSAAQILNEAHYPIADAPTPSANGTMALVLLRLGRQQEAEQLLNAFAASAQRLNTAAATYMRAVMWATSPVSTLVVINHSAADLALWQTALRTYRPRTLVRRFLTNEVPTAELPPELSAMISKEAPRAYLCAGRSCAAPVPDSYALQKLMREFRGG